MLKKLTKQSQKNSKNLFVIYTELPRGTILPD